MSRLQDSAWTDAGNMIHVRCDTFLYSANVQSYWSESWSWIFKGYSQNIEAIQELFGSSTEREFVRKWGVGLLDASNHEVIYSQHRSCKQWHSRRSDVHIAQISWIVLEDSQFSHRWLWLKASKQDRLTISRNSQTDDVNKFSTDFT